MEVVGFGDMNTFTTLKLALAVGLTVAVAFINAELALAILAAAGVIAIMLHDYAVRRVAARSNLVG
jgi:membrane protein implicated in regulation of membrane protease activity